MIEADYRNQNTVYRNLITVMFSRMVDTPSEINGILEIVGSTDETAWAMAQRLQEINQAVVDTIMKSVEPLEHPSVFSSSARINALAAILTERKAQDAKWGYVQHDGPKWLSILMEEVGEMCQDIDQGNDYKEELIQVVAVAMSWLEAIECKATQCPGEAI